MNFKIATIVLAILWIGTIVYFTTMKAGGPRELYITTNTYDSSTKSFVTGQTLVTQESIDLLNEELREYSQVVHFDNAAVIDDWKKAMIDSTKGTFYSVLEANDRMRTFNDWNQRSWNFVRSITPYGFSFGRATLREMLKKIDRVNDQYAEADSANMINGIRINLCISKPENRPGRGNMDVMITPIKRDGSLYYFNEKDLKIVEGKPNMNTSSPCPELCN